MQWSLRARCVTLTLGGIAVLLAANAGAAARARPFLIGVLNASWGPTPQVVGLRDGLLALGYRENEDFVIGVRFTQGDLTALPDAAQNFVQDGVDIIVAEHDEGAKAARQATTQIPIVCVAVGDPLGHGLIQSFARPGGNITGVADLHLELGPKRLEVFRELIPGLRKVLFIYHATDAYATAEVREVRAAAHRLGLGLVERPVRTPEEAQAILAAVQPREVDGVLVPRCCALNIPGYILETTTQRGLPAMFEAPFREKADPPGVLWSRFRADVRGEPVGQEGRVRHIPGAKRRHSRDQHESSLFAEDLCRVTPTPIPPPQRLSGYAVTRQYGGLSGNRTLATHGVAERAFFLIDMQGIVRWQWIVTGGKEVVFSSEPLLKAVREVARK
jgi:putative ABC transport system substrate-binding protein